jgi:hypothetical protein
MQRLRPGRSRVGLVSGKHLRHRIAGLGRIDFRHFPFRPAQCGGQVIIAQDHRARGAERGKDQRGHEPGAVLPGGAVVFDRAGLRLEPVEHQPDLRRQQRGNWR